MRNRWLSGFFLSLGLAFLAGCAGTPTEIPLQREILKDSIPLGKSVLKGEGRFRLVVEEVVDRRPEIQIKGLQSWNRGLFSPGRVNLLGKEASGYQLNLEAPSEKNLLREIREEVIKQARSTGYFSSVARSGSMDFRMELELMDYYGTSFLQSRSERDADGSSLDGTGYTVRRRQFLPYGFSSLKISLFEGKRDRLLWQRILNGVYQPHLGDVRDLQYEDGSQNLQYQWSSFPITLSNSTVRAMREVIKKIPMVLQLMMNQFYEKELAKGTLQKSEFTICQLSRDGSFLERVTVDISSGKVKKILFAKAPLLRFSRPGEWVLDPYQGSLFLLSRSQYESLAEALNRRRYNLVRLTDVYIYHFMGMK